MGKNDDSYLNNPNLRKAGSIWNYTKEEYEELLKVAEDTYNSILEVNKDVKNYFL
jgi:hypothetical protein